MKVTLRVHRVHEWQAGQWNGRIGGPPPAPVLVSKDILEYRLGETGEGEWQPVPIKIDPVPPLPETERHQVRW